MSLGRLSGEAIKVAAGIGIGPGISAGKVLSLCIGIAARFHFMSRLSRFGRR